MDHIAISHRKSFDVSRENQSMKSATKKAAKGGAKKAAPKKKK
jgi:hypothetical protein